MPKNITTKPRKSKDVACKFYLPTELDSYIRVTAQANFRTFTGQIEAMLQHAKKAGV